MWAGRNEWARISEAQRHSLLEELLRHLGTWKSAKDRHPRYFAVAVHKDSHRGRSVLELAHEELFARFTVALVDFILRVIHIGHS